MTSQPVIYLFISLQCRCTYLQHWKDMMMPKCAVGCVDLGNVAEQFLCVWNDFHVFIMLTRYLVEDSSSKTYDFSPISQRMRLFCRLQRVFRNSWRKKCHWINVAEIKFSHFCPSSKLFQRCII